MSEAEGQVRHYFVDEAGDATVFNSRGRVIVGEKGCSRFFILGFLDVQDVGSLSADLKRLRAKLMSDPYFSNVPSMQPENDKTAVAFHAKDDLPEVRREVFSSLSQHELRFFAVVRDKRRVLDYVLQRNEREAQYRYHPNELYDSLVRRLFKEKLHKADAYDVIFSRRGLADRTDALRKALDCARARFSAKWGISTDTPIHIQPRWSRESAGLQAVDYFLWALQRLYERQEDRFLKALWPHFRLVQDADDTRKAKYGVYYSQKCPLNLAAIKEREGI